MVGSWTTTGPLERVVVGFTLLEALLGVCLLTLSSRRLSFNLRLTKELTDELGRSNGPPRREDRSEVPGERSEVPRHRGRDDDYDQQFPTHASSQVRRVTS